ncbi:uncharacterized protein DNG_07325 [Cephalotrichum gorgonifer]|uniref:Heterokaryon incompatibility domain-containing protein n=1 Tax=Cephalotrichum gorgonifer TaxID=2041049 RepID=A0AAE8N1J4_9PEZI|nr:uncharacterized protein DNG_07325 [Cephalotrichum gorgonifer]
MVAPLSSPSSDTWSATTRVTEPLKIIQFCPARPYAEVRVPENAKSVDRLTIITVSHDQGFSNEEARLGGTYEQSYSWFEVVAISASNHERAPVRVAQVNVHARSEARRHENVYDIHSGDAETRAWLAAIRGGDTVQLIPRAQYPAWTNYIYEAELKIEGQVQLGDDPTAPLSAISGVNSWRTGFYETLDLAKREIRVLGIEAGAFDDPVVCSLATVPLMDGDNHIAYEALSYCWGHLSTTEEIEIHPIPASESHGSEDKFAIPTSLHLALRYLRPETGPARKLWVDFICINQDDLEERAAQVAIMPYIYSNADAVRIWLGPGDATSRDLFDSVRQVASLHTAADASPPPSSGTLGKLARNHGTKLYDDFDPVLHFVEKWRRCDFMWFKRTWVLQEVANAKKATVHCGHDAVPWAAIMRLADCINKAKQTTSLYRYAIMPPVFSGVFEFRDGRAAEVQHSVGRGILEVVVSGHDLDASDPRDKLFALLQFGTDTRDLERLPVSIKPDYRKSDTDVFADFTRWWIVSHGSLRILSTVHTTRYRGWQQMTHGSPVDLATLPHPTWCFWYDGVASWAKATLSFSTDTPYRATRDSTPDLDLLRHDPGSELVLRLRGHRVCTITSIEPYPFFTRDSSSELDEVFIKLFDPIGDLKTWMWIREEQVPKEEREREPAYGEHYWAHYNYIHENNGSLPCFSPCFLKSKNGEGGDEKSGLCPHYARVGDAIVVLYGGRVPYILRPRATSGQLPRYEFVGECYLLRYMDGKALDEVDEGGLVSEVFDLV